jgi:hypothetical protein
MELEPDGAIALTFKSELFAGEFKAGESGRATLESVWAALFGQPLSMRVVVKAEAGVETAYEEKARKHREALDQRRKDAAEHPAVKRVVAEFGGRLVSVRLANEEG